MGAEVARLAYPDFAAISCPERQSTEKGAALGLTVSEDKSCSPKLGLC